MSYGRLLILGWILTTASLFTRAESISIPDFSAVKAAIKEAPLAEARMIHSFDGVGLAVRHYVPRNARAVMLFLHAPGAHSALGYQNMAYELARDHRVIVVTPDYRGHGQSEGEPGDAPSRKALFQDIDSLLRHIGYAHPDLPIFIGAHGASAGLLLNYQGWHQRKNLGGLAFVSPYFGPKAALDRRKEPSLVKVHKLGLIANKSTLGLACGHCQAFTLPLPHAAKITHRPMVETFTANFARPFVPAKPVLQIRQLRIPYGIWTASKDEYVQGGRTKMFLKRNGREPWMGSNELVRGAGHYSVLLEVAPALGQWIEKELGNITALTPTIY